MKRKSGKLVTKKKKRRNARSSRGKKPAPRLTHRALSESNELLEGIFNSTDVMIAYLDRDLNFVRVNRAYAADDDREPAYYVGKNHFKLFPDSENEKLFREVVSTGESYIARAKRFVFSDQSDRGITHWDIAVTPVFRGKRVFGLVLVLYDVTEFIQVQERMQHLAYHDSLTELPNRNLFFDRVNHAIEHSARSKQVLAVVFLDIDRFKLVNDSLGHQVGDALLRAFANRLSESVRKADTIAHISGDEFAIALEHVTSINEASRAAQQLIERISAPLICEGREFFVTSSIGISVYPIDGEDAGTLMKHADVAMHKAKEAGGNTYKFYTAEMGQNSSERLMFESHLGRALEREEFALHFQPIYGLASGKVVGVEALLRWNHPTLGLVSPIQFVPLLEETGMIIPVGEWVLRQACSQVREWQALSDEPLRIAVNLSPRQFKDTKFAEKLTRVLRDTGLAPELLELEITEGILMQSSSLIHDAFFHIRDLGCKFAIDDFGTGYSSLSYLRRFPVSTLKIDRSFVVDVTRDGDAAVIVRTVIAMAHLLKMEVIAEGVETAEQLEFLRVNGCEFAQGYLLARPMPAHAIPAMLASTRVAAADRSE